MSWNASYNSKAEFAANTPNHESPTGTANDPTNDQAAAARAAAQAIIDSGAVGDESRDFVISISGHVNPEHAPTPGYANDCVTINISQKAE